MTSVEVHPGTLAGLDRLDVESLALPLFEVRAQPAGAVGLADWRLCGRIARLLKSSRFAGAAGEVLLMPARRRIGAVERVFLFGLGPPDGAVPDVAPLLAVLSGAGVSRFAIAPPPGHDHVAAAWLPALSAAPFEKVAVLDATGALMAPAVRG